MFLIIINVENSWVAVEQLLNILLTFLFLFELIDE